MKLFKLFTMLAMIVVICVGAVAWQALNAPLNIQNASGAAGGIANTEDETDKVQTLFVVPNGAGSSSIVAKLQSQRLIQSGFWLKVYLKLSGKSRALKAGEYTLDDSMSALDALNRFETGQSVQYQLTLIDGWNIREVISALNAQSRLNATFTNQKQLTEQLQNIHAQSLKRLKSEGLSDEDLVRISKLLTPRNLSHPEGLFLPETYAYTRMESDQAVLVRAHAHLLRELDAEWTKRSKDSRLKTPYDALIMASIIEKETGVAHERPEISGVFNNRLIKGMRLQTDPTVIYGLGEAYDGDIRFKDLRTDTPYNTYTRYGLPPTPIAIAGKPAIHAALNPKKTDALFFVSRNDGTHIFSSTLKAHEAAVDRYQRNR